MRLSFNALLLAQHSTGMRTQLMGMLKGLQRTNSSDSWVVYLRPGLKNRLPLPQWERVEYIELSVTRTLPGRLLVELFGLPFYDKLYNIDVSYSPTVYLPMTQQIPAVITFIDFCWRNVPTGYTFTQRLSKQMRSESSLFRAAGITTISETMRKALLDLYGSRLEVPVVTTPSAVDEELFEVKRLDATELRRKFDLGETVILTSGGTNPRKDIRTLVNAFLLLPEDLQASTHMVILGPYEIRLKESIIREVPEDRRKQIVFTGFLSYKDKLHLYSLASLFVFPTLDEGFGLPVLEAMAAGVPVICSDIEVLREVGGDTVCYFHVQNVEELARYIQSLLESPQAMDTAINAATIRARTFSWKSSAQRLLQLMKRVK